MKAIISSTYDDRYLYFIPICVWAWNKLGIDVICFMPDSYYNFITNKELDKLELVSKTIKERHLKVEYIEFKSPKNKEATYAQCSRLYAACLDLPEDEVLITSDVDIIPFKILKNAGMGMTIHGIDLVPNNQLPICYITGEVKEWRKRFNPENKTYQELLDEHLAHEECTEFRGNMWQRDQEIAYQKILGGKFPFNYANLIPRGKVNNEYAANRIDRNDAYMLEKLSPDNIDFHLPRPGFEDKNFDIILKVLKYHYPNENFDWLISYTNEYRKLL